MKSPLAPLGAALIRTIGRRRRGALTGRRLLAARGRPRAGDAREMADVRLLTDLDAPEASAPDRYRIDERTWNDLDMPLVFGALDRTLSAPGAHRLHQILSTPLLARPELEARERLISLRASSSWTRCSAAPPGRAAAAEILAHLAREDIVLAATHDLEIGALVADQFDGGHFEEQLTETGLAFDYRLRPGPCLGRNAIALLRLSGYPAAIVDAASRRALGSGGPGHDRPGALPPDRE